MKAYAVNKSTLRKLIEPFNPSSTWKEEFKNYTPKNFQQDLLAGITVGVVALPLALAFGITSGAGAAAGLITAIIAGFIASALGGSRFNISGPTGAMTVVLLPIVAKYGVEKIFIVGIMASFFLVAFALLKFGRLINLIPYPVVTGFTNGIAVIIFLQQIPALLGLSTPKGEHILSVTGESIKQFSQNPHYAPVALGLSTVALIMIWNRKVKHVPSGIVALISMTLLSLSLGDAIPRIGPIPSGIPMPHLPSFQFSDFSTLLSPAIAVALLAGIESLMSAVVADGMSEKEKHDPDRELLGSGIANLLVPLFGGVPATGAIARTAVNVRSGANTRMSGMIHAVFLLLVVLLLGPLASHIPRAALAGILIATSIRMIEWEAVRAIFRSSKSDLSTMMATMCVTIAFDLILAIEVGLILAGMLFVKRMASSVSVEPMDFSHAIPEDKNINHALLKERVVAFRVDGPIFFAVAGEFIDTVAQISKVEILILRLRRVQVIDASGANALKTLKDALERKGITVLFSGIQTQPKGLLERMGLLNELTENQTRMFTSTESALDYAWSKIESQQAVDPLARV